MWYKIVIKLYTPFKSSSKICSNCVSGAPKSGCGSCYLSVFGAVLSAGARFTNCRRRTSSFETLFATPKTPPPSRQPELRFSFLPTIRRQYQKDVNQHEDFENQNRGGLFGKNRRIVIRRSFRVRHQTSADCFAKFCHGSRSCICDL